MEVNNRTTQNSIIFHLDRGIQYASQNFRNQCVSLSSLHKQMEEDRTSFIFFHQ
jgi:hypothetical protein